MEEGSYTGGHGIATPENVRDGGRNRGHGRRGRRGGGARGGGRGGGSGRSEKKAKFEMYVCPKDLRFTQDSIANKFKAPFDNLHIDDAVHQILIKVLSPSQMPPLNVVKHIGILWSLDNRRLWVFRTAGVEEIRVNLVPKNFSPRSCDFFTNLTADLEKIYSNPMYYPRVRGRVGNIYYPHHFNDVEITGSGAALPSLPTCSPQQNVVPKSTDLIISMRNDAAKEDSLHLPQSVFKKEDKGIKPSYLSRPDRVNGAEISGAGNESSFPKVSSETEVVNDVKVFGLGTSLPPLPTCSQQKVQPKSTQPDLISIRNNIAKEDYPYLPLPVFNKEGEGTKPRYMSSSPDCVNGRFISVAGNVSSFSIDSPENKVIPSVRLLPNPRVHHHVINIRDPNPYVRLPSSEKESVSENGVIRLMNKLFHGLRFGTLKFCSFCYDKGLLRPFKFLRGIFKRDEKYLGV